MALYESFCSFINECKKRVAFSNLGTRTRPVDSDGRQVILKFWERLALPMNLKKKEKEKQQCTNL